MMLSKDHRNAHILMVQDGCLVILIEVFSKLNATITYAVTLWPNGA